MATISKTENGKWQVRVRKSGFRTQTKTFKTKREASVWARQIESDMDRRVFSDRLAAESTTIREAFDRYRRTITPTKKGAAQELHRINRLCQDPITEKAMGSLKNSDVAAWRDSRLEQGDTPAYVVRDLATISHLYTIAVKEWSFEGLANPVKSIRRPRINNAREYRISREDEARILEAIEWEEGRVFVTLAIETGMRRSELGTLTWDQIKGNKIWLPDTKNGKARWVPLSSRARAVLAAQPRRIDGKVWMYNLDYYTKVFMRAVRVVGLGHLTLHDCRHECTSRLFEAGWNIMEVAAVTGHESLSMLRKYTHLKADDLAEKMG